MSDTSADSRDADLEQRPTPSLWRNRNFLLLWTGAGATSLSAKICQFVYPMLALWATDSASSAGLVVSAGLFPQLLVQLPAGVLVDRLDRRRLMLACDLVCVLVVLIVTASVAFGATRLSVLVCAALVQATCVIFYDLAERSAVRHVVPRSQLPDALGQNEARARAAGLLGQPVGGGLFVVAMWLAPLIAAIGHTVSYLTLRAIKVPFQQNRQQTGGFLDEARDGLRWIWGRPLLRMAMVLIALSNIVFSGLGLTVMYIVKSDGGSPAAVGVVAALGGVGGLLGALTAQWWLRRVPMRHLLGVGFVVWAATVVPLAYTENLVGLGAVFAAFGYVGGVFNVSGGVYLVQVAPDEMMGRAVSMVTLLGSGLTFLGGLIVGPLLDAVGTRPTVWALSGAMALLAFVAVGSATVRSANWLVTEVPDGA